MDHGTKEHAAAIVDRLKEIYPHAECALEYGGDGWRLLVMARLSAQCTDKRVNEVAKVLFAKYPTADALANAPLFDVEETVRPCGLYRVKARNIIDESRMLCDKYGGVLPQDMDELMSFPGVGRKIANLLRGDLFSLPAIVVDTHMLRLSARLGLVSIKKDDPVYVERILSQIVEPKEQSDLCHRIVLFGRDRCTARGQRCNGCPLFDLCKSAVSDII